MNYKCIFQELEKLEFPTKERKRNRVKRPKKFAVIDCETDPFDYQTIPKPFIWGFYDGLDYLEFFDTDELIEHIKNFDGNIYAHNGGKFDYHFLFHEANTDEEILVINSRLSMWKMGKATLYDSFNIFPVPQEKLQKNKFDYDKMKKEKRLLHMKEIREYLESDCIFLYKYIKNFIETYGQNLTIAATALKLWNELTIDRYKAKSNRNDKYYYDWYPWYFGGRVTPFKTGIFNDGPYQILDINSAYPYVMKNRKHPMSHKHYRTVTPKESRYESGFFEIVAISHGALPVRITKGKYAGIYFPISDKPRKFTCTGYELITGLETGTIELKKILNCYIFEDVDTFEAYVNHFYDMKLQAEKEKDEGKRTVAKLFLNSLYGKFAANPDKYRVYMIGKYGDLPPEGFDPDGFIANKQIFSRKLMDKEKRFYNIATAASITSAVRAYLWESIHKCDDVYYCDTDSVIIKGSHQLNIGDDLGQWKIEGTADKIAIAGKKMYCAFLNNGKHKLASKGVRLTPEQMIKVCNGEELKKVRNIAPTFTTKKAPYFIERDISMEKMNQKIIKINNDTDLIEKEINKIESKKIKVFIDNADELI